MIVSLLMLVSVSPCPIEVFSELMCVCEGWGGDAKQSGPLPRDNCLAGTTGGALENL